MTLPLDFSHKMIVFFSVQLKCCGLNNYTDWKDMPYFAENGIPQSCCKEVSACDPVVLKNITLAGGVVYDGVGAFTSNPSENSLNRLCFTEQTFQPESSQKQTL